jgi:hypothetical protein
MAKKYFWKVWLRRNLLTKEVENDYVAEVSTAGKTQHNEGIAEQFVERRSEHSYEFILSILNERDAIVRRNLLGGTPVQDGNVHLAPRVPGSWIGVDPVYDPKVHKPAITATITAEMRKALEEVGVEVLGKKTDGGAIIGLVTDLLTGKTDGTVTTGGDIIIKGEKIKIEPAGEPGLGVFFVQDGGMEIPLDYPLTENTPKKLVCRLPAQLYPGGVYTLKIVTRSTSGGRLLNDPRTILYDIPLTVVSPQP